MHSHGVTKVGRGTGVGSRGKNKPTGSHIGSFSLFFNIKQKTMVTITRRLPQSNRTRQIALGKAKLKADNPGVNGNFLTTSTNNRLTAIESAYNDAALQVQAAEAALGNNTLAKNAALAPVRMYTSHFLQVFNLGAERGDYPKGDRAYYGMNIENPVLPPLRTDSDVYQAAGQVIEGDALRIAAGGAPMANPTVAQVQARLTAFNPLMIAESNLKDALDAKQEALEALNAEADKVIKKVWDEVETFYNEEATESLRANAREWGVVYVGLGEETTLTFEVKAAAGGAPIGNATVRSLGTGHEVATNAEGIATEVTRVVGDTQYEIEALGYVTQTISISIEEGVAQTVVVELVAG